jgi:endonuclease/exonuclease/phosphatase family metal-dependent hydrolase
MRNRRVSFWGRFAAVALSVIACSCGGSGDTTGGAGTQGGGGTGATGGAGTGGGSGSGAVDDAGTVDSGTGGSSGTGGTGGTGGTSGDAAPPSCSASAGGTPVSVVVPSKGTATSLDIGGWNIEWFGDSGNGPSDDNLQRDNVTDVLLGTDMDIWGLAEVVSTPIFNQVLAKLPGYRGFLADNSLVEQGSTWYTATEQKLGFVYKCDMVTVTKAKVILTDADNAFAGRPPLEVTVKVTLNGATMDLVVIVVHAKCCSDASSWTRRRDAAAALKPYLDSTYPTQKVIVVGDFNDDLDMSITSGSPTPYANFLADTANYTFISKALTDNKIPTEIGYPTAIDHHLTTNEMAAQFISNSIEAYNLTSIIANYGNTTTDHFPIVSRYNMP